MNKNEIMMAIEEIQTKKNVAKAEYEKTMNALVKEETILKIQLADLILSNELVISDIKPGTATVISVVFEGGNSTKTYDYIDTNSVCQVGDEINVEVGNFGHTADAKVVTIKELSIDDQYLDRLKEYVG